MAPTDSGEEPAVRWRDVIGDRWILASVGALIYWTTVEALRPMVALQLDRIGASASEIGVAVGAYAVLGLILSVPGGAVVDRVGPRRLLLGGFLLFGASGILYVVYAMSVTGLAVVQLVAGAAALAVWVALQSAVTYAGAGDVLRKHLAVFATAWAVGMAIGPIVGGWLFGGLGFRAVAGLLLIAGVVGAVSSSALPVPDRGHVDAPRLPTHRSARQLIREPVVRLVLASSFVSLAVQSLRTSFYPLFLSKQGLRPETIGAVLTLIGVASVAVRLVLPALGRRFGARAVLVWSTWFAIAWAAAVPALTTTIGIVVGAVVLGVSLGLNPPTTVELIAGATAPGQRGTAMGLRVAANRSAQIAEPVLFGIVASVVGASIAFIASGGALGVVFALFMRSVPGRGSRTSSRVGEATTD